MLGNVGDDDKKRKASGVDSDSDFSGANEDVGSSSESEEEPLENDKEPKDDEDSSTKQSQLEEVSKGIYELDDGDGESSDDAVESEEEPDSESEKVAEEEEEDVQKDEDLKEENRIEKATLLRKQLGTDATVNVIKTLFDVKFSGDLASRGRYYFLSGGSLEELLSQLQYISMKKKSNSVVIFQAIQITLIRVMQEKLMDTEELSETCKHFVTNHIVDVLALFSISTPIHFKKVAIKLLSALATVDDVIASQILSSVDFTMDQLKMLTVHEDPTNPASLRVLFIHFLMSLIVGHSPGVIRKLCNKKMWLPSIVFGLRFDLLSTVGLVLKTLDDNVVMNGAVAKTSKLFVFNSRTLINLLALYNWNPLSFYDYTRNKQAKTKLQIKKPENSEVDSVRELVHGVLLHLLTLTKLGVIFHDPSYGTSALNANETANQCLKESGQPWEDALKEELISSMLSTCPDLLKSFYNMITPYLQVENTSTAKWMGISQFLIKTISNIKIIPESFSTVGKACTISTQILLPSLFLDSIASSLQFKDKLLYGILLYIATLRKIKEVAEILRTRHANVYKIYVAKFCDYLVRSSVTADKLLGALQTVYEAKSSGGIAAVCEVILSLGDLFPQTLDPVKYNSTYIKELEKIIDGSKSLDNVSRIKLIKLQLLLDPQIVKKERVFDFGDICSLIASDDSDTKELGLGVIRDILFNTGFFLDDTWELELWIMCINQHFQSGFGKKLASAVRYAENHKFELSNSILRSHQLQSSISLETHDLKLDDFLAMEETDSDCVDMDRQNMRFSPLLPGFLRANDKMGNVTKAFIVHYAHMVPSKGFVSLVKESLGRDHVIVNYLESLGEGKLLPLNFTPFIDSVFERVSSFILQNTPEDCLENLNNSEIELVASQVIRCAVQSRDQPEILSRCGVLLTNLCERSIENQSNFKSECVLRYSDLLDGFHPILSGIGHVNKIVRILGKAVLDRDHPNLKPFAQRIYFELEYAIRKKLHLQDVDIEDLESFLKFFPMTKNQVVKLISGTFVMGPKYFVTKGRITPWVKVIENLLLMTSSMNLELSQDELLGMIRILSRLVNLAQVSELPDLLHIYFSRAVVDVSGSLLDAATDLLRVLCTTDIWYGNLACTLMGRVENQLGTLPGGMEFMREVTLLASVPQSPPGCLDHAMRSAVKALAADNDYLVHLAKIASHAFSAEVCCKMASKVEKHSSDVYPSSNVLKVLEAVFSKADKLLVLLSLVKGWMETYSSQQPDLCIGISEIMENIASKIESSDLPELTVELVDFLISDGMSRQCKSMIGTLRIWLTADRLPLDPAAVFQKLTAHSKFDFALMGTAETFKCAFISLLSTLIEKDGSLINGKRLPGFLSAYQATLSVSDQLLLKILQQHEKSGVNLTSYKPLLWGEAALSHYSVHKKPALSKSHPYQILDSLSPSLIINTIANFPIHRDVQGHIEGDGMVYDPAFILPLLCHIALPGHKIKSRSFFQSGAVGLGLASLSSSSPSIRSVATLFLQRLHENHIGQDKIVWTNFIDAVRRGVVELMENQKSKSKKKSKTSTEEIEVPRLCSITATFLARASTVLGDPSAPLYRPLHHFILARPALKLYGVPAFLELLNSTDFKYHERHREWILEVIRDGMREPRDLQIVLNSFTLKIILVFYSTSLVKPHAKKIIEQIIEKCLKGADKEASLLTNYSILPWILGSRKSPSLLSSLPKLSPFSQHGSLLSLATR